MYNKFKKQNLKSKKEQTLYKSNNLVNKKNKKTFEITLKKKIINHVVTKGKVQKIEKTFFKVFKSIQKIQKKNHNKTANVSIVSATSTFRIIKLKSKNKKKKVIKEIPALLSAYTNRTSWSIKNLIKTSTLEITENNSLIKYLTNVVLLNNTPENSTIKYINELQNKILTEKKYFKYYRW